MTKIVYKPHCAKCGALIDEEVSYRNIITEGRAISDYSYPRDIVIDPYRCNWCGEMFNQIEVKMPKKDGEIRIR